MQHLSRDEYSHKIEKIFNKKRNVEFIFFYDKLQLHNIIQVNTISLFRNIGHLGQEGLRIISNLYPEYVSQI